MKRLFIVLEMIKFEHTIFAIPFAFLGAFLAVRGFPGWRPTLWIILAMFGARSAAMGFNRLVDADLDSRNPRTANRALPRRILTKKFVAAFVFAASLLFFFSAWNLNRLALLLSPLALFIILSYSYTKRFTSLSHLLLGLSLGIAPVGGWVAVRGSLEVAPFYVAAAVIFWVAGFDIIYACQDVDFDRSVGLYSMPSRLGIRRSLQISSAFHILMICLLVWTFWLFRLSIVSWIGLGLVALGLIYEHSLVKAEDLSNVNAAFFAINGIISVVLFVFVGADLCLFV